MPSIAADHASLDTAGHTLVLFLVFPDAHIPFPSRPITLVFAENKKTLTTAV